MIQVQFLRSIPQYRHINTGDATDDSRPDLRYSRSPGRWSLSLNNKPREACTSCFHHKLPSSVTPFKSERIKIRGSCRISIRGNSIYLGIEIQSTYEESTKKFQAVEEMPTQTSVYPYSSVGVRYSMMCTIGYFFEKNHSSFHRQKL